MRVETRELCLVTLGGLGRKIKNSQEIQEEEGDCNRKEGTGSSSNCLQMKKMLPFYYLFLDDPSSRIRGLAAESILSFGPQAELLFIEGMTKGTPLTKMSCIRCLGKLGVQNFRAVVLGLRDGDANVRRVAGETIVDCFTVEEIVEEFGGTGRRGYSMGLVCNLRDVVESQVSEEREEGDWELQTMIGQILTGLGDGTKQGEGYLRKNEGYRVPRSENTCLN